MIKAKIFFRGVALVLACASNLHAATSSALDEFKIKRKDVFEFVRKPEIRRDGRNFTISFESKDYCDVTVAIEDESGVIVRHLVSGVLGPNAPEPLQKGALTQTLVWDGKSDVGAYVENQDKCFVRVSLGLKPQFERNLYWEPKRRIGSWMGELILINTPTPLIRAAPEGMYVFEGYGVDHLRLFDHAGNYSRTVYPFPANKINAVKGLEWHTQPQDGTKYPQKTGFAWNTMLTSGTSSIRQGGAHGGGPSTAGSAATAMAVANGQIALTATRLNRLGTDGSSGGLPLEGPATSYPVILGRGHDAHSWPVGPTSSAFSPDGKWLYMTGFIWSEPDGISNGFTHNTINAVVRMEYASEKPPELFAGSLKVGDSGNDRNGLNVPVSVATDAKGRVYVADNLNDRIQVFSPDGELLKSIPANKPARVQVHQKTGDIYIFSWSIPTRAMAFLHAKSPIDVKAMLTHCGPFDDPKPKAAYPLPFPNYHGVYRGNNRWAGTEFYAELDSWSEQPAIWMVTSEPNPNGDTRPAGIQIYVEKDGQLVKTRDFGQESFETLGKGNLPAFWRQRLFANSKSGKLYIAEQDSGPLGKAFHELVEIDPETGASKMIQLPFDAEDMTFDADGYAYLRGYLEVGRYDASTWTEVPWDYGEEEKRVSFGNRAADMTSGISLYSGTLLQKGGIYVNQKGNMAVSCYVTKHAPAPVTLRTDEKVSTDGGTVGLAKERGPDESKWPSGRLYVPNFFPGRFYWGEVHIYDKYGKILYDDAIPGINELFGVALDRDDNIYVLSTLNRMIGRDPYPNPKSGTLMKFKPKKGRIFTTSQWPNVPVKLSPDSAPQRPADFVWSAGQFWQEGAEWTYGGVGFCGKNHICSCWGCRFALDYFARSFVPEMDLFSIAALDTNGNLIMRIGRYGNVDSAGSKSAVPLGGDEVGLFYGAYVAVHTDKRLYIADPGNQRIVSVKIGYHEEEKLSIGTASESLKSDPGLKTAAEPSNP